MSEQKEWGITFQMSLDNFLKEEQPEESGRKQSNQAALLMLQQARQVRSWKKKQQIAEETIAVCEDCIEAWLLLGSYEAEHRKRLRIFQRGMELATMKLGKDFFLQSGDLYEKPRSHPFFHIKFAYARELYENGCMRKAQLQFQELLNLNLKDVFHARQYLILIYLYFEEFEQCRRLLAHYGKEDTFSLYARFLCALRQEWDEEANSLLPQLKQKNRYLYELMTYQRMNTVVPKGSFADGSLEEAACLWQLMGKITQVMEYVHVFLLQEERKQGDGA